MESLENIFCKIELVKNNKDNLNICIHLNPQASNIQHDGNALSWSPTKEELNFLLETIMLINKQDINKNLTFQIKNVLNAKNSDHTNEKSIDRKVNETIEKHLTINKKSDKENNEESIDKIIKEKMQMKAL